MNDEESGTHHGEKGIPTKWKEEAAKETPVIQEDPKEGTCDKTSSDAMYLQNDGS